MSVFVENSKGRINHCFRGNDIFERWFLKTGRTVLFSICVTCKKPLAMMIDTKTKCSVGKLFVGQKKIEKLRKKMKKYLDYKSGDFVCHISTIATGITQ